MLRPAFALSLSLVALTSHAAAQPRRTPPRIAVVIDGPTDTTRRSLETLADEVDALLQSRYEGFSFPRQPTHVGDFTEARSAALLAEALADRQIDLVVGFGLNVGRAVGRTETLPKPVFLPFAAPELQGLPRDGARSGRANLSYLTGLLDLDVELRRFREIVRRERAVVLVDAYLVDGIENLAETVERIAGDEMDLRLVPAGADAESILAAIPADARSVYIGPLVRLPDDQIQPLIDGLNARRLPTYASSGRSWVDRGAFTSLSPADDVPRRLRRVALNIEAVLSGDDPSELSTRFATRPQLVINMATARTVGVWPTFELMTEAELVGQQAGSSGPRLTLRQAVDEAVRENVDLAGRRLDRDIASAQVRQALGSFFPTVDLNAQFTWLDPGVASPLANAERQLSWGATAQQLVFSPAALSAIDAGEAAVATTREGIAAAELDVVLQAAEAYLDVLRARTAERINRENLRRIRRNLALAEVRVEIGASGRQDVYRWQSEIADARSALIQANSTRNQAEIALNRILSRGLEAPFSPVEPDTGDAASIIVHPRVGEFVDDPHSFRILRELMAREAIANAPELRQIDAAITTQEAVLRGRRQQLYIPDVFVTAGITHTFVRDGEGADDIVGMERDDFVWQLGAGVSFRLFDYGRYAEISENETTIGQLHVQRDALAQRIEQGIRTAMHQAGASRAAMRLRRDAAEAAAQNLELVADAYAQGTVDLIVLLDAQTQALSSELAAANAVYDFLIDYIRVERAAGHFSFRASDAEREAFVRRLNQFAADWRPEAP